MTLLAGQLVAAFTAQMGAELDSIQNGSLSSNQVLNATLYDGLFLVWNDVNMTIEDMSSIAVQLLTGKLLGAAWSMVPDDSGVGAINPAIL